MSTNTAVIEKSLAALPLKIYQTGETVLAAGSTTGQLLILRKAAVAVVREGIEIARMTEPGAVFGEICALLDQPHSADVRALASSQIHVASTTAPQHPSVLLYVAAAGRQRCQSFLCRAFIQSVSDTKRKIPADDLGFLNRPAGQGRCSNAA